MMLRPMDIWRCAIVRQSADAIMQGGIAGDRLVWLPETPPLTFQADPFGLWRDDRLHVFVEAFDYRVRVGRIDLLVYDKDLVLLEQRTVLARPWHLSYPIVFEADGEAWLLPEAYKSGTLTLYRARHFPDVWEPVCDIELDGAAIDATPVFHRGLWWLFYTPSRDRAAHRSHLHVAWSRALTGPWQLHPANPVLIDPGGARPGGTVRVRDDTLVVPVQDCRATYGHAIRDLVIDRLDETGFSARHRAERHAPGWMAPYAGGLHTLSEAGPVTLIDVKRMDASLRAKAQRLHGIVRHRMRGGR